MSWISDAFTRKLHELKKEHEILDNPLQKYDFIDPTVKTYLVTIEMGDGIETPPKRRTFKFKSKQTGDQLYEELDKLMVDWVDFTNQYSDYTNRHWDASIICFACLG